MTRYLLMSAAAFALAACEPADEAPDALPDETPAETPVTPAPTPGPTPTPAGYVGAWAADPAWCENTTGPERPVRITATRFEGYENSCDITEVQPADGGWTATFTCQAEGMTNVEQVGLQPDGDRLELTWTGSGQAVTFTRCPD